MFAAFRRALAARPLITQMTAAGIISSSGDALCQLAIEKRALKDYDLARTGRFFVVNAFIVTPVVANWLKLLERIRSGPPALLPLKRVFVDQLLFSPWFQGVILIALRRLEGFSHDRSVAKCKEDWWRVWTTSLKVWPVANLINFYLFPLPYRVIYIQVISLFWNSYLSYVTQHRLEITQ